MLDKKINRIQRLTFISLALAIVNLVNINVIVPSYIASFSGGVFLVGIIYSFMAMARGFSGVLSGFLRDRIGEKLVLLFSISIKLIAFIILFLANTISFLVLGLIIHALGSGVEIPAFLSAIAIIADEISLTATLFGFALTLKTAPTFFAPVFTGYLADNFSIRIAFLFGAFFTFVGLFFMLKIKPHPKVFNKSIRKVEKLILNKDFLLLMMATYFLFIPVSAFTPIFSYWIIEKLEYNFTILGLILASRSALAIFSRIYTGILADRLGNLNLLIIVGLVRAIALTILPFTRDPLDILLLILLYGSLMAAPPRNAYISKTFNRKDYGKAFGTLSIAQNMGLMTGPVLAGYIAENWGYFPMYIFLASMFVIFSLLIALIRWISKIEHKG